jgi:hypothetical protein
MLEILGLSSIVFVFIVTLRAAYSNPLSGGQTIKDSLMEIWTNIVIGFSFNYVQNFILLPLVDAQLSIESNFYLGWIYTATSFIRQFLVRRWFNRKMLRAS